ncbi:putative ALA-interacting subunit 2 [Camellia lanceoleosa]|uniref:ALA-interacting subunit 2 n=1 Tax=Camellia lanceoleosa TaxID=1840588 RepID=A0ACC0J0V6_9ERIC|nr:putative ALA-interacting subunit 2 [Camellia lanceoleosa]
MKTQALSDLSSDGFRELLGFERKPYIILTICRCKKKQWRNGADQLPIYPRLPISVAGIKHKVPKYMKAPIYIYYQLDNYYQNHRRFSRGTEELKVNRKNIAWKSDRYHKFGKHVYPFNFQNGTLIGGGNLDPNIPVGDRCQVEPGEKEVLSSLLAEQKLLDLVFWIGVQYDEPLGKHDGMVKGTHYFDK